MALAGWSAAKRKWIPFFVFGALFTIFLNGRYVVEGMGGGIPYFVGIFDVVAYAGIAEGSSPGAFASCAGNDCTVWADTYASHHRGGWRFTTGS